MIQNQLLTWESFKSTLQEHPELALQFQYAENKRVDVSYHITEIKQASITSVDCGGVKNFWTEIIVQLWEPEHGSDNRAMSVSKALSIVAVVEKVLPLHAAGVVKIEFGNSEYQTRQMYPGEFIIEGDNLVVNLNPDFTQCKAVGRGGSCGTEASPNKAGFEGFVSDAVCCAPGAGCC
jgi:hypothetical protein